MSARLTLESADGANPVTVLLETTGPSNEEDVSGLRLRTPPDAAPAIPSAPVSSVIQRRDLLVDVGCARVLTEALGAESTIRVVPIDVARLLSTSSGSSLTKSTAIVMSPVLADGVNAVDAIEKLRGAIPHVGMYVLANGTAEVARILPKLAAAGVDEVFCLDSRADVHALQETLKARLAAPAPETEIRLLWKWFRESPERSLVMHCVRNGFRLDVWSIRSKVFSACRKTLQNRVSLMGLPSPGILSRCGRVLHAQELERRGVKPTALVAEMLGFPSSGAMQRARRRLRKALMSRGRQALVFASLLK